MRYPLPMAPGIFQARPNRFIALVELDGEVQRCHVPNTGRLGELLLPGAAVWCAHNEAPGRKTAWSLLTVQKGDALVNIDSQAPNHVAAEYVAGGGLGVIPELVKAEQTYGDSRLDLYYEAGDVRGFVEVKGVTLNEGGVARFPDAPTQRGRKHLMALKAAAAAGYRATALFVIQMDGVTGFSPNAPRDPAFAQALCAAATAGVEVKAVTCRVTPETLSITGEVPVMLETGGEPYEQDHFEA